MELSTSQPSAESSMRSSRQQESTDYSSGKRISSADQLEERVHHVSSDSNDEFDMSKSAVDIRNQYARKQSLNDINKRAQNQTWFSKASKDKLSEEKKSYDELGTIRKKEKRYITTEESRFTGSQSFRSSLGNIFFKGSRTLSNTSANLSPSKPQRYDDDDSLSIVTTGTEVSQLDGDNAPDVFQAFSHNVMARMASRLVQVNVRWRETNYHIKVDVTKRTEDAIATILETLGPDEKQSTGSTPIILEPDITQDKNISDVVLPQGEIQDFELGKIDRNMPCLRTWMAFDVPLSQFDIIKGDELILRHCGDVENIAFTVPPNTDKRQFSYGNTMVVGEAIKILKEKALLSQSESEKTRYGLYWPRYGLWLDESRTIHAYEFPDDAYIELRALVNEVVLRIFLEEYQQKIAIRVLPTLQCLDVIAMINYQMTNRKLVNSRNGQYGLYIPSKQKWLEPKQTLDQYTNLIQGEDVVYKVQYQNLRVTNNASETFNMLVDEQTKAQNIVELLSVCNSDGFDTEHSLHFPTGEVIKPSDSIWPIVSDISGMDCLLYRLLSKPIVVRAINFPGASAQFEIDFSQPLVNHIPFFCRKFGIKSSAFEACLLDDDPPQSLDLQQSLDQLNVAPGSILALRRKDIAVSTDNSSSQSTNIWDEPTSLTTLQLASDSSKVVSGTLNKLVEKLTEEHGEGTTSYLEFVKTFLLTYQSFTNALTVIDKLIERYYVPHNGTMSWEEFNKRRQSIQLRVCNVLLQWTKKYNFDFQHPEYGTTVCDKLLLFIDMVLAQEHLGMAKQIRKLLFKLRDGSLTTSASVKRVLTGWKQLQSLSSESMWNKVQEYSADDIASQLTMIEHHLFTTIAPSELLNQAWTKKDAAIRAPGIVALTRRFNAIASWVASTILDGKTPKLRAERMAKFIEISQALMTLNNFSALMSMIAGMNKASISRLKQTHKELPTKVSKKLAELEKLMSAEGSYKNYRACIHSVSPPCIPYIGTYLVDLTYMEDGNPDFIESRINFAKRELIGNVVKEMVQYQQTPYSIKPIEDIAGILANIPDATEDIEKKLWLESKKLE